MLRSKNNKPVVTLTIRDRTLSTNKSASSKDPSFISIFNRRISNIKRNVYQLDTENSEFYQSYSLSKSYLKYKDPFEDIKKAYNDKGYKIHVYGTGNTMFHRLTIHLNLHNALWMNVGDKFSSYTL